MPLVGFPAYLETCAKIAANNYEGFDLNRDHGLGVDLHQSGLTPPLDGRRPDDQRLAQENKARLATDGRHIRR
jgi:hypothetical protein